MIHRIAARDGTKLAVHEVGSGPPLLCVPGGPGRASDYLEDLGGLGADHTLLLLDNRGTGRSELPADRASLAFPRLADDVEDVRERLGLEAADVLGHSAGCAIVLTWAHRYPASARRLVLVTPSARAFGWDADDVEAIARRRSDEPWYAEVQEAVAAMRDAPQRVRAELERRTRPIWYGRWDERAQAHAAGADRQMSLRANAGYWPDDYDPTAGREILPTIEGPALVLAGEVDTLTGVRAAALIADALPDGRLQVLDGCGHFPWVDDPAGFRDAAAQFLRR